MTVYEVSWLEKICVTRQTTKEMEMTPTDECYCCRPQYVGKSILICGKKQSFFPSQCLVGPDWPCMICTYSIITVPTLLWIIWVAKPISDWLVVLGAITWCSVIVAFSFTACSDPGIVFRPIADDELASMEEGEESEKIGINENKGNSRNKRNSSERGSMGNRNSSQMRECSQCDLYRPPGAQHCYDCQVCVEDLDHHCPWTGKCIGKKNISCFYAFLFTLTVHIIVVGLVVAITLLRKAVSNRI